MWGRCCPGQLPVQVGLAGSRAYQVGPGVHLVLARWTLGFIPLRRAARRLTAVTAVLVVLEVRECAAGRHPRGGSSPRTRHSPPYMPHPWPSPELLVTSGRARGSPGYEPPTRENVTDGRDR